MNKICGLYSIEGEAIALTGVSVTGDITGRASRVNVSQRYYNSEDNPIEAVYRFPLPEGATITKFRVETSGRIIESRIEERGKAFDEYDEALSSGNGAYLLDEERPNIFTMSVGNLLPNTEAVITIELVQLLDMDMDRTRFFLPTTISPRYVPAGVDQPGQIPLSEAIHPAYSENVHYGLTLSLNIHNVAGVNGIESPSHPIRFVNDDDCLRVELSSEKTDMDRDFILYISHSQNHGNCAYLQKQGEEDFMQVDFLPDIHDTDFIWKDGEIIFVVDCSGSMQGESITEAKKALEICLKSISGNPLFNIIRFGSEYEVLMKESVLYSEDSVNKAVTFVRNMQADLGGTELIPPLKHILSSKTHNKRDIVIITDGEIGIEQEVMSLIRGYNKSTRFHVIGIGSGVNEHLVKGVVRQGNGECAFIHPGERIEPKMIKLFQKLMMPVLTDLRISLSKEGWEICSEKGVIVAGVPSTFFARRSSCSGIPDTINICAKIADKTFSWDIQVVGNGGNDLPISQLWARERIRELEEGENSGSGSRQKERKHDKRNQAIIEVSRKYGVISTLTSLIGIEKRVDAEKNTSEIVLRRVPSLITKGWHGGLTNVSRSSVMGPLAGIGNCISTLNEANYVYNVHTSLRKIVSNKTFRETDYSIRSKITKKTDQKDVLFEILNLQKPTGGLELNDTLFKELVISKHDLIQAERDAYPSNEKSIRLILSTAILLEVLEQHFPDMEDIWRPTVKKSSEWLDAAISKTNVQIGGIHLKEWAAGFSKNKVKYSENPCLNT